MSLRAMDALNQMTQGALAPYIEAQQRQAYFAGAAQVAQGRALLDIEREEPWYTKIFGPSATVQGAQAMTAMTALAQADSEVMRAMPQLRSHGPQEMQRFLAEQAARIGNTGDAAVDGIVQQKLMEQWSTTLGNHMKQHIAWQQEDMARKFISLQVANGELLQATLAQQEQFDHPDQMAWEVDKFKDGLARPAGMTDEAYGKVMSETAKEQLHRGQFAAYEAMKATPHVWQAISPEARQDMLDSEALWTERAARDKPVLTDFMTDRAKFTYAVQRGAFPGTEADLHAAIDGINTLFREQTGGTQDSINNVERGRLVQDYYKAKAAHASAYQKIQEDAASDQAQQAAVALAYNTGDPSKLPPGVSADNLRRATEEYWNTALTHPEKMDTIIGQLVRTAGEPRLQVDSLKWQLRQDAQSALTGDGALTERQQGSLGIMRKFLAVDGMGAGALAHHVGTDMAASMQALVASGANLDNPEELETARRTVQAGAGAQTTQQDIAAAEAFVIHQDRGWLNRNFIHPRSNDGPGLLRNLSMNDATKAWLAKDAAPEIARQVKSRPGLSLDAAARIVLSQRLRSVDLVDGTLALPAPHQKEARTLIEGVRELSKQPVDPFGQEYQDAVRDRLHANLREMVAKYTEGMAGADTVHFDPAAYAAVSGHQLGAGYLMVEYRHTGNQQPFIVQIAPQQVLDQLVVNRARAEYLKTPQGQREAWLNSNPHWKQYIEGHSSHLKRKPE